MCTLDMEFVFDAGRDASSRHIKFRIYGRRLFHFAILPQQTYAHNQHAGSIPGASGRTSIPPRIRNNHISFSNDNSSSPAPVTGNPIELIFPTAR